jgi:hypothetical protein
LFDFIKFSRAADRHNKPDRVRIFLP